MSSLESRELLTAAQMRALEQAAIDSGAVTGLELMERAGRGVVEAIFAEWPELKAAPHRALILCGPGNNGGDGFVVARYLYENGWSVAVWLLSDDMMPVPHDAHANAERYLDLVDPEAADSAIFQPPENGVWLGRPFDVVIDAVFGTGLSRPMSLEVDAIYSMATSPETAKRIVAVDAISGFCLDSGRWLDPSAQDDSPPLVIEGMEHVPQAAKADLVVTFHRAKLGHAIGAHSESARRLKIADIGLERSRRADVGARVSLISPETLKTWRLIKRKVSNKYTHGHALILSGPMGRSGAARLAARAALRVGAGLVTVAAPGSAMMECATQLTAIMLRKCDGAEGLVALLEDDRLNALCLGPGLGVGQGARELVSVALSDPKRKTVLDADALTSFAEDPQALFDRLHDNTVLTPHAGEFARLFPDIAKKLSAPATTGPAYSKLDACRDAAARAGCVVLYKGPDTVIAHPSGRASINAAVYDRAAPWLATAGSGDVLAGLITGLMARGLPAFTAAENGAWLHVEAARAFGPGLIAEDLPEMLPQVFRDLGL